MADRATAKAAPSKLVEGLRIDQPTFHALYDAMPPGTRAELIDGVVYLPSPLGLDHGNSQLPVVMWLGFYVENTLGVQALVGATAILDSNSEPQPDGLLRVLPVYGGQTWNEGDYVHGPPELVAEISKATRYVDLGPKLRDYERTGVLEYVVRARDPDEVFWFVREEDEFQELPIGANGLYRSRAFPGLWLDPAALLAGDTRRLRAIVEQGCATSEHAAFVAKLASNRQSS
jgi:hypothetical protein